MIGPARMRGFPAAAGGERGSLMQTGDAELVRRLRGNDRSAFEAVIDRHHRSVYGQLWHLCGDADTAADLTQETFLQAWKSLPTFQGRSAVRTWLATIAVRVWQRWRHGRAAEGHVSLDELADALPDTAPGPAERFESRAEQAQVQAALRGLPPDYRETLVMFYMQGLKYREIAAALEIPIGTVKSRLHNGLQRLKAALGKTPEEVAP